MQETTRNPEDQTISRLLEEITKALVDTSDEVRVEILDGPDATTLRLHVADAGVGKLIGKQGRTARSLRTILAAASMKHKRRFALDIAQADEPDEGRD